MSRILQNNKIAIFLIFISCEQISALSYDWRYCCRYLCAAGSGWLEFMCGGPVRGKTLVILDNHLREHFRMP